MILKHLSASLPPAIPFWGLQIYIVLKQVICSSQCLWRSTNLHGSQTTLLSRHKVLLLWMSTNLHGSQTFNCTNQLIFRFWGTTNLHGSQSNNLAFCFSFSSFLRSTNFLHDSQT